jgi:FXSXX-COOH protein
MQDDLPANEEGVLWSDLPDLSGVRLSDLDRISSSALVESVRHILDESGRHPTTYSQYMANI